MSVRRKQLTNQNYCFRTAPKQPPQAECEEEMQRGKGRRKEEEPPGSVNLTDAESMSKRIKSHEREQIKSYSSVGSKRMRQHLGAR